MLLGKIRITVRPEKIGRFSERRFRFYVKYASFVFKSLRRPIFQRFLNWVLFKENITEEKVENIHVMIFPLQKENGKGLAGKCTSEGEIYIYPKRLKLCRKLKSKLGHERVFCHIKNRAKAALIHELLHLKYLGNEHKVRELTENYVKKFNHSLETQSMHCEGHIKS